MDHTTIDVNLEAAESAEQPVTSQDTKKKTRRKKGQESRPRGKVPAKTGLQQYLCSIVEDRAGYRAFRGDRNEDKMRTILQIMPGNVCRIVSPDYLGACLADYVQHVRCGDNEEITHDQCTRAVRRWSYVTSKNLITEWPAATGFKSAGELVFCRLPFDPEPFEGSLEDACPTFWEISQRMGNWGAFCLRFAAVFRPNAPRKQTVHIYGPSDGGKSFIQNLLMNLVGGPEATADLCEVDLIGAHWKSTLVAKALILLREASPDFFATLAYKALGGDPYHTINPKGQAQYKAKIDGLIFSCSNEKPHIPPDDSFRNRAILCHLAAVPPGKRVREDLLMARAMAEAPKFLWHCLDLYDKHGDKPVENDAEAAAAVADAVADYEEPLRQFFNEHFRHVKNEKTLLTSARFQTIIDAHGKGKITAPMMRAFFVRNYGSIIGHLVKKGDQVIRYITEVSPRY